METPDRDIALAKDFIAPPGYSRHRPEATLLYQLVAEHQPRFRERRAVEGRELLQYAEDEFEAYFKSGLLEHGFLQVKCGACLAEKLVAFSCKRHGFCPSCGARRMAETAALLVDSVLPQQPIRPWVLSLPFALRYLLATRPEVVTHVLGIVYRAISAHLIRKAGLTRASAATGAVTVIQRFGSALNLNVHVHRARPCARQRALAWAPPLKRVFAIDIYKSAGLPLCTTGGRREAVGHRDVSDEICLQFGGRLRVIASIEVPAVIDRILAHLGHEAAAVDPAHPSRAPPRQDRLI